MERLLRYCVLVATTTSVIVDVTTAELMLQPADYSSDWLPLKSQARAKSELTLAHGLGTVPALVEVLVKSTDPPNEGFIFKAIGHGPTDDDYARVYGSVMYTYDETSVRVYAPSRYNQYSSGRTIYTGINKRHK